MLSDLVSEDDYQKKRWVLFNEELGIEDERRIVAAVSAGVA